MRLKLGRTHVAYENAMLGQPLMILFSFRFAGIKGDGVYTKGKGNPDEFTRVLQTSLDYVKSEKRLLQSKWHSQGAFTGTGYYADSRLLSRNENNRTAIVYTILTK